MSLAYPKPKDQKHSPPPAVIVHRGGREVCDLNTTAGRAVYDQRMWDMRDRQGCICCLFGHIPECPGNLDRNDTTFDHEVPRGHGGGERDDRIEVAEKQKDGTVKIRWQNGAAHSLCNFRKGSRRIPYNAQHNGDIVWELIPKTTRSGKVLFRCPGCGYETPAPTKNHQCGKEHNNEL